MSDTPSPETTAVQRLLLRAAAAVSANEALELYEDETSETVNQRFVEALGLISRVGRLDDVVAAARPIANYLAGTDKPGGEYDSAEFRLNVQRLVTALAALHAFDNREADHTIVD